MRCRKCDFDNDADALFCEQCGKDLSIPAGVIPLQKLEQVAVIIAKY